MLFFFKCGSEDTYRTRIGQSSSKDYAILEKVSLVPRHYKISTFGNCNQRQLVSLDDTLPTKNTYQKKKKKKKKKKKIEMETKRAAAEQSEVEKEICSI